MDFTYIFMVTLIVCYTTFAINILYDILLLSRYYYDVIGTDDWQTTLNQTANNNMYWLVLTLSICPIAVLSGNDCNYLFNYFYIVLGKYSQKPFRTNRII